MLLKTGTCPRKAIKASKKKKKVIKIQSQRGAEALVRKLFRGEILSFFGAWWICYRLSLLCSNCKCASVKNVLLFWWSLSASSSKLIFIHYRFFPLRKDERWCCATNCLIGFLGFFNTNSCVAFSNICNFFDHSREGTVQCFKGNDADLRPNRLALYSGPPCIHIISLNKHWTYGMPKWYIRINLLDNCHANYIWQLLQNQIHICYSCDVMTTFKLATVMHFWLHGNLFNSSGDAYFGFKYSCCSWTDLTRHLHPLE